MAFQIKFLFDVSSNDDKNIILFGAGSGLDKFADLYKHVIEDVKYIVDNDSNKWGSRKYGRLIKNPLQLKEESKNHVKIFVTSQYYEEIATQLKHMGFDEDVHFWKVPGIHSLKDVLYPNRNILVTMFNKNEEGTILKINLKNDSVEKISEGRSFRGICRSKNGYAFLDNNAIYIFDNEFKKQKQRVLSSEGINLDLHGIEYDNGFFYIIETITNSIKIVDENTLQIIKESNFTTLTSDVHHINDLFIVGDSIFISMISKKGYEKEKWWSLDDGAIVELDKFTLDIKRTIKGNLKFPHSVKIFNNEIYFCESKDGNLSSINKILTKFNGFTRGLDFDGKLFYVGQSIYRGGTDVNNRFSQDAGIYVYSPFFNISRFIKLSQYYDDVYAIHVIQ